MPSAAAESAPVAALPVPQPLPAGIATPPKPEPVSAKHAAQELDALSLLLGSDDASGFKIQLNFTGDPVVYAFRE